MISQFFDTFLRVVSYKEKTAPHETALFHFLCKLCK